MPWKINFMDNNDRTCARYTSGTILGIYSPTMYPETVSFYIIHGGRPNDPWGRNSIFGKKFNPGHKLLEIKAIIDQRRLKSGIVRWNTTPGASKNGNKD
jgi:hypothetical protein